MAYHLTKDHLRLELHSAFVCAKQHKSKKPYVVKFAKRLDEHLDSLCDDLWNRNYTPEPSTCFIVEHPKKREVFAAQFRDRVVHHQEVQQTQQQEQPDVLIAHGRRN